MILPDLAGEIIERNDIPGSWSVEARCEGELVQIAVFGGPDAKQRAFKYARAKYSHVIPPPVGDHGVNSTVTVADFAMI